MFAGGAHDLAADRHAAGEEDVIKPLMQQRLIFRAAAFDQRDVFGREALGDNLRDDLRRGGRVGRRLEHAAVARRQRADQRLHQQHEGIIPRRHNQRHAVRLADGEAVRRKLCQRGEHAALFGEAAQMRNHVGKLGERHARFTHVGFGCALAQILHERGVDGFLVRPNGALERKQALFAESKIQRLAGSKEAALSGDELLDRWSVHAFSSLAGISFRYICARRPSSISTGTG